MIPERGEAAAWRKTYLISAKRSMELVPVYFPTAGAGREAGIAI
jgi:hypothetical protein